MCVWGAWVAGWGVCACVCLWVSRVCVCVSTCQNVCICECVCVCVRKSMLGGWIIEKLALTMAVKEDKEGIMGMRAV